MSQPQHNKIKMKERHKPTLHFKGSWPFFEIRSGKPPYPKYNTYMITVWPKWKLVNYYESRLATEQKTQRTATDRWLAEREKNKALEKELEKYRNVK